MIFCVYVRCCAAVDCREGGKIDAVLYVLFLVSFLEVSLLCWCVLLAAGSDCLGRATPLRFVLERGPGHDGAVVRGHRAFPFGVAWFQRFLEGP